MGFSRNDILLGLVSIIGSCACLASATSESFAVVTAIFGSPERVTATADGHGVRSQSLIHVIPCNEDLAIWGLIPPTASFCLPIGMGLIVLSCIGFAPRYLSGALALAVSLIDNGVDAARVILTTRDDVWKAIPPAFVEKLELLWEPSDPPRQCF